MRSLFKFFALLSIFVFVFYRSALAADSGWEITQFQARIEVGEDARVKVQEKIVVDFGNLQRHGIFRNIPIKYKDRFGNNLDIRLKVEAVKDEQGRKREYRLKKSGKQLELKIGDPDQTITGSQTYVIEYSTQRVVQPFEDHDELYWNVTGNHWPVTIQKAEAVISVPYRIKDAVCFSSAYGSSLSNCSIEKEDNQAVIRSLDPVTPGSGLTIAVAVPKGIIQYPDIALRIWWLVADNWPFAIPILTLLAMMWLYWQHGRDENYKSLFDPSKGTDKVKLFSSELVPTAYAPLKDLKPAVAGTLIDEEINIRDIAATIIDLAVRGYVKIEEIKKGKLIKKSDYKLIWVNQDTSGLAEFETTLLLALFGKAKLDKTIKLSQLKYKFHTHLGKIRDSLYDSLKEEGYFIQRPDKVVKAYRISAALIGFAGTFFFGFSMAWALAFILSGIIIFLFSKAMPKRTAKGRKHYLRVVGLKNFINLGAYRQKLWEKANIFEEVMPYAIALDLTHKWAEAFEKASVAKPQWYSGTRPFNPINFAYSMEDFTRSTTKTLPSTRSASSGSSGFSGGFSGGGFGGGGGGSW